MTSSQLRDGEGRSVEVGVPHINLLSISVGDDVFGPTIEGRTGMRYAKVDDIGDVQPIHSGEDRMMVEKVTHNGSRTMLLGAVRCLGRKENW